MKKLILCAAAVAAMATAGGVYAQSADCARGMSGADPCGVGGVVVPNPQYGDPGDQWNWNNRNSRRWNEAQAYDRDGRRNHQSDDRDRPNMRNDRDRDGVRDSRDRHPDDRRRH